MKFLVALAALTSLVTALPKRADPGFTVVKPGSIDDIEITEDNVLNGTRKSDEVQIFSVDELRDPVAGNLPIELVNNFGDGVNMYIQGLDSDNRIVFIGPDGTLIYPSSGGSAVPVPVTENIAVPLGSQGSTVTVTVTIALHSGRIYFAQGELEFFMVAIGGGQDGLVQPSVANPQDPSADVNYAFSEFTLTPEGVIWTNISFVDFIGMIISLFLQNTDGSSQEVVGLPGNGVELVCNDLAAQTQADGLPWAGHCLARSDGTPLRVVSPNGYAEIGNYPPLAFCDEFLKC